MGIGVNVVISPLVPLCEDQVRVGDHLWGTDEVSSGLKKPEKLQQSDVPNRNVLGNPSLTGGRLATVVIDETHCVSQRGP